MYSCGEVIYGYPLVNNYSSSKLNISQCLQDACEEELDGFLSFYSGSSDEEPRAFGVRMSGFDCVGAYVNVKDLKLEATDEHKKKFEDLLKDLPETLQNEFQKIGVEPQVFVLWTTS